MHVPQDGLRVADTSAGRPERPHLSDFDSGLLSCP